MLKRMRGGIREKRIWTRGKVPGEGSGVTFSSDFISGFCGETEEEHEQTLALLRDVEFEQAFMYAYSMRERTHAWHRMQDDVPEPTKKRRLQEVVSTFPPPRWSGASGKTWGS